MAAALNATPTLAAAAGHNARWLAASQAARVGLQLVGLLLLSRLLAPAEFGLMAMVVAVTNFALLWRDLGTATALVRASELSDDTVSSVFWLNLAIGTAVGALLALLCTPIAALLGNARLAPLLLGVALSFPLQGASAAQQALLERAGRFRALALVEFAAGAAGLTAAVLAAAGGWGAASLVLQTVLTVALSAALLWLASGWRPRLAVHRGALRRLLRFSAHLTAFNCINYITRNADSVLIGRLLGPLALGSWSLALRVTLFPVQNLTWAASRALLPVMSRAGQAPGELAALYLRSVGVVALLAAPLTAGLFALRHDFVAVALGPQWTAAGSAALLAWLAPVGFVQAVVSTVGPVFLAAGRSDRLLRLGLLSLTLIVSGLLLGLRFGIQAVAAGYLAANLLQAGPCLWAVMRQLGVPAQRLLRPLALPLAGALPMAALLLLLLQQPAVLALAPLVRLAGGSALGAAVYLALAWALNRAALHDALRLLHLR